MNEDYEPEEFDPDEFGEYEEPADINEVIDALLDSESTFPPRFLYRLSGLEGLELEQFNETWPEVDAARRERLLEDLEILADTATHLDFDQIFILSLGDASAHARQISIRGLWESDQPSVARRMLEMLERDPEMDVRIQAARGLGKFVYLGEMEELSQNLFDQITDQLLALADSDEPEGMRRAALESLGFCSLPAVNILIEAAANQDKEDWLISALIAIGRSANIEWSPVVIENLNHDSPQVRVEAAQAAGLIASQSAAEHLLQLIDDPEPEVRQAAIWALSEIGGLDARAAIEGLLRNAADEEEIELLEDALENLDFTEMAINFDIFDLSEEDLSDMIEDDPDDEKE
jgi:HEAT repeat protein